jgi:hypothetical protein
MTDAWTSRFPAPWRIVEIPRGFAVEDAAGQQLAVLYGRSDPNIAGHTGFLTMDEARQMAVDFARLPELLKRTSGGSEVVKATPQRGTPPRTQVQTPERKAAVRSTAMHPRQAGFGTLTSSAPRPCRPVVLTIVED